MKSKITAGSSKAFDEAIGKLDTLTDSLTGLRRDKAIWNTALFWASRNAYMEVIDEFTGLITEEKLEGMDLADEIYQVSRSSILAGLAEE